MENSNGTPVTAARTAPVKEGHQHHEDSISGNSGNIAQGGSVHDRTGLYLAIVAFGFSCMAIGTALILPQLYTARADAEAIRIQVLADRIRAAEQSAALAREDLRIIQQALAARGIQTDVHEQEKGK